VILHNFLRVLFGVKKYIILIKEIIGLENGGGLREQEDLRGPFIISLRVQKMSGS